MSVEDTRVHLLATGGTIASKSGPSGRSASVTGAELLSTVSEDLDGLDVSSSDLGTRGSYAFDLQDLLRIEQETRLALDGDVAGVVVTHGTDTMEETAFLVDLFHADSRPIVFTGAQRAFDDAAPDGPANLRGALRVASSSAARDRGALLAFDGFAFGACGVRKVDTLSAHAFDSPGRGPVMRIGPGQVWELTAKTRRTGPVFARRPDALPRVDVVAAYPAADGTFVEASLAAGAVGLVVAGVGIGNVGPLLLASLAEAIQAGVPVVVTSRVSSGPVLPLYAGGGAALAEAGAHFAGDLSPWQARLLLSVACADEPSARDDRVSEALRVLN